MSAESYKRWSGRIGRKTESVFRNADTVIIASQLLAIDLETDDEFPFLEPILQQQNHNPIGAGRNAGAKTSYQGFPPTEETLPLMIQSAVQLFMALGACSTDTGTVLKIPIDPVFSDIIASGQGTAVVTMTTHGAMVVNEHAGRRFNDITAGISYTIVSNTADTITLDVNSEADADGNSCSVTTTFTDTIATGQGTAILTMTSHGTMVVDEHIGRQLNDLTAVKSYGIIDNDATTITIHKISEADANGNSVSICEGPFIHTITEANMIPSQALHLELENDVDAESIRTDILGVIVNTLEQIYEKLADGIQNVGVIAPKAIAGSDLARPTNRVERFINWSHASTFTLTYNSANPVVGNDCNSVTININNNAEIRHGMGDGNAVKRKMGLREYNITLHIFPENDTLRNLVNTEIGDYLSDLTFVYKVQVSVSHSIQYTYSKLKVIEYPKSIPAKDASEKGLDCKLENAGGTLAVIGIDGLNIQHYEG